jgi:hypothetical protein
MQPQLDMPREWTYDELVAYVESLPYGYEIVDGTRREPKPRRRPRVRQCLCEVGDPGGRGP